MAYSQGDGALLASGGADHTVRVWDAKAGADAAPAPGKPGAKRPASAAGAAAGGGAQAAAAGGGGAAGAGGAGSGSGEPYGLLATWKTKLTPVFGLRFTARNLLLGSGALTLPQRPPK